MAERTKINPPLADCAAEIAKFTGNNLASRIAELEFDLVGMDNSM
jgi:hypothetical protein